MADNTWIKSENLNSDGEYEFKYIADQANSSKNWMRLTTKDKFVDKNIFVQAVVKAGSLSSGNTTVNAGAANAGNLLTAVDSQPANGPYLTVTGQGTVSVDDAGWLDASTSENSTPATKYYTITEATFTANGGSIKAVTGGYIAANATAGSVSTGTITNNTTKPSSATSSGTINRGNYIKIGAGYYSADKYYLAQANSGTYTVTDSGTNISIDGKAYLNVASGALQVTGGGLNAGAGHGELTSAGLYNGTAYDTSDKIDISTQTSQATNYYKLTASGYGSVSRAAIKKQITTAGWFNADGSAVQMIESDSINSNSGTTDYYVKKSVLSTTTYNGPTTANVTITVPAGYYPSDRTITVNKLTARTPTTSYAHDGLDTYFTNDGTSSSYSVSITPRYSVSAGYIAAATNKNNGGVGYWNIKTATPAFDGGAITTTTQASASSGTTITTNPATGVDGVTIQTKYLSNRAVVQYNGAVEGWVSVADDTSALAATNNSSYTNGQLYYLTQVTVPKDKKFTIITSADTALDTTSDLTLTNNAFRQVIAGNAGTIYARHGTSGKGDLYGRAYGESTDQLLIDDGAWKTTTITANTSSAQTAYGKVTVNKLTAGTISTTETNPASGYTENTQAAVPAGGYLLLSAGYYTATKISLATLIGDATGIIPMSEGGSPWVHPSYKAYDDQGRLLQGTMEIYEGTFSIT